LVLPADKKDWTPGLPDPELEALLFKLAYTCSPEIVPTLIRTTYEAGPGIGDFGHYEREALLYYVPRTEEIRQTISAAIARYGSIGNMEYLLQDYGFNHEELKAIIERALASDNPGDWQAAARLATYSNYDEAFTTRLTAIASSSNGARGDAIFALALNRTDAGVQTLKTLLNDADPNSWEPVALAILTGYESQRKNFTGRMFTGSRLHPEDFDAKDVRPLIARMLDTGKRVDGILGVNLAEMFGDDGSTAKLVALATNPGCLYRDQAIYALALNRTDEGVKTLQTLLQDPAISGMAEGAIRYAYTSRDDRRWRLKRPLPYTSRADARGRPLRAEDFDAKFRDAEVRPAR
jgi:hypothetical protein